MPALRPLILDHFSRNIYVKFPCVFPLFYLFLDFFSYIYVLLFFMPFFHVTLNILNLKFNKMSVCMYIHTHMFMCVCMCNAFLTLGLVSRSQSFPSVPQG